MTTTAEVKQLVAEYPADAQRVVFLSSQLFASDEGLDEVAREMVALANRAGGRIVVGVDRAGVFETTLAVDFTTMTTAVTEVGRVRVVPSIAANVELLVGGEGDLLVVKVPRRPGNPHACARVGARGNVGSRAYYVRQGNRTRRVTDAQLAWMYRVVTDPAIRETMQLTVQTRPMVLEINRAIPQPRATDLFARLLRGLDEASAQVLSSDADVRLGALVELAPWAFLAEIDTMLGEPEVDLEVEEFSIDDLPVPGHSSRFIDAPGGLRGVLGGRTGGGLSRLLRRPKSATLLLPAGADVLVDHLARQGKTRVMINHSSFTITFSALPGGAGAGLGWPEFEGARSSQTVWSRLRLVFNCSLPFPDQDTGADRAAEQFLEALVERLRTRWDGTRWLQSISPAFLSDFAGEVG